MTYLRTPLLFVFCLAQAFFSSAQNSATQGPLVIATYTYDQNTRLANLQPLARHLEQQLHQPVKAVSYASVEELLQAVRSGEADLALMNTLGYLLLAADSLPAAEPLVSLATLPGQAPAYTSCLFANRQSGIQTLADLKQLSHNATLLMAGKSSTSGNYIQRLFLRQHGFGSLDETFKDVQYVSSHAQVVQHVKAGLADVGACGAEELYLQLQNSQVMQEDISILWISEEIPLGPVVIKSSISPETKKDVLRVFLQLPEQNPAAFKAIKAGWTEAHQASHYQVINQQHYTSALGKLFK